MKDAKAMLLRLAVLAALIIAADRFLLYRLRHSDIKDWGVVNSILAGRVNAQILVSGSSRAVYHYDCGRIEKITGKTCYNIGFAASLLAEQYTFP